MQQIGLPDIDYPTPVLNDNQGSIDWIDSGCKPTKKLRHENLVELGIYEAKKYNEVSFFWIPGKTNPADVFTKEDSDKQHYHKLRDLMVIPRELFSPPPGDNTYPDPSRWGVLKGGPEESRVGEEEIDLTQLTKKSLTPLTTNSNAVPNLPTITAE